MDIIIQPGLSSGRYTTSERGICWLCANVWDHL